MAVSGVGEMGVDLSGWGIQVNRRPLNPSGLGTHSGRRGWKSIFVVGFGILPNKVVQEESLATAVIHPPLVPCISFSKKRKTTLCVSIDVLVQDDFTFTVYCPLPTEQGMTI